MYDGSSGSSSLNPIFIMAATGLSKLYSLQGFFPLAISSMEHPKDHISDFTPYSYYLIISGAIHGILPLISSLKFLLILVRVLFILFGIKFKSLSMVSNLGYIFSFIYESYTNDCILKYFII